MSDELWTADPREIHIDQLAWEVDQLQNDIDTFAEKVKSNGERVQEEFDKVYGDKGFGSGDASETPDSW